jgi:uncharacterized protein
MDRETAFRILSSHAQELRSRGVQSLSLFGSTVRDQAKPDSDVDVLIDLGEEHRLTLLDLVGLKDFLIDILRAPADVTIRRNIKPLLKDAILADEVRVF